MAMLIPGTVAPQSMAVFFSALQEFILTNFGWVYVVSIGSFLGFLTWLFFSRFGDVRLGPDDSRPSYSLVGWFAMLFSAGMGIGLMFYGVAEPLLHFSTPPVSVEGQTALAKNAMLYTFFHWGLHAWGIYALLGMSLAYFHFRKGLPLSVRSVLSPFKSINIHGHWGNALDIFAVIGTLFGIATSLGLGVMQINEGLARTFGMQVSPTNQLLLIAGITFCATLSVVSGLDKGILWLSRINLVFAAILLVFVFFAGPTLNLIAALLSNTGMYLKNLVGLTFNLNVYGEGSWQKNWTLFYWAWWVSWAPFVGIFIARISRGRSIREFILGVLLAPTLLTFCWFTIFGNSALFSQLAGSNLAAVTSESIPAALYVFLEKLPWAALTTVLATIVVVLFFVTSSDSGSLVVDMLASGGLTNPPVAQRIFWATLEGAVAAVLLLAGGLKALQTAAISSGLPLCFVVLLSGYALLRALQKDHPSL